MGARIICLVAGATASIVSAQAQQVQEVPLPTIEVIAEQAGGRAGAGVAGGGSFEQPTASSERTFTAERLAARPLSRPGEILEAAPGLIVTQHSGEGKANQYFLRGFNLDHGTDIAITVDGMPANMRTHGHGQGYADINFIIPELVGLMHVRKGPYFAQEGDFASAGAVHLTYIDKVDKTLIQKTIGSFGYFRALGITSTQVGQGNLLVAADANVYNGPWVVPDRVRKFNGVIRYSQGDESNGFSLTGMAYSNRWNSTDQIPERAVAEGLIGRFGTLDPTDGGNASRLSLSGRWSRSDANSDTRVNAYVIRSNLNLYNNFTYYLDDPVNGDQFRQFDRRTVTGFNASHTFKSVIAGLPMENEFGVQGRLDQINVGLENTIQRITTNVVRHDSVREGSLAFYGENRVRWTDWLRTSIGLRGDLYDARVRSDTLVNSGYVRDGIVSPKFGLVLGPWAKTEFFFNAGRGFHSNDARGSTITVDPSDKVTPVARTPLLVRANGVEVGVRTRLIEGLDSSVSLFGLDYASENLFVGDAGTTEASRPSRRYGVEFTNHYKFSSWLSFDVDFTWSHARFRNFDPVGPYIPGAPTVIAAAGVNFGEARGWFGGLRLRYFGPRPLIEDNSVASRPTTLVNARVGYRFDNGISVQLDAFNLFNAKASQIDYYYASRLPGEPAGGIADRHFHPVEPLAVRLTIAGQF
ncbi:outer membrane receptor protein involved in Fe transport [Beijerinckia sp. GAS462]|nr:outer membrane receptor protein involved in Fe transport [Beijerinckia sp. GAS462]SEC15330.1 Outer membrane receptor proteins, mostly Fe transport [Beijerinckia sp. 28-YEA-48]